MTGIHIDVFPSGAHAGSVTAAPHPVAASAAMLPGPVAGAATAAPSPVAATVVHVPHGIAAVASGADGIDLIVH